MNNLRRRVLEKINSMTIIDNISTKKPKFTTKPRPEHFKSRYEEDAYWDEEKRRWIEGYKGLTGRHYCYITQGTLKPIEGNRIQPYWRDGDDDVFTEDDQARKFHEDTLIVKRREFGLTSIFGGFEPIYNSLISSGSISVITSADRQRVKNLFSDKILIMYEGLAAAIQPKRLYERVDGFLHFGEKNAKGDIVGVDSQIICLETAKDDKAAKSVEGSRAMYIFLDELFLHPRATTVRNSAQANMTKGFAKKGHLVMGGSCGFTDVKDTNNAKKGAVMGEQMWRDAQAKSIHTLFIPGWKCISEAPEYDKDGNPTGKILNFCINGYSNEKAATEWILRKRDKLEKASDKSEYINFIKQYPLTIEEVFEINRGGILPKEVYDMLAISQKEVNEGKNVVVQCDLYEAMEEN